MKRKVGFQKGNKFGRKYKERGRLLEKVAIVRKSEPVVESDARSVAEYYARDFANTDPTRF